MHGSPAYFPAGFSSLLISYVASGCHSSGFSLLAEAFHVLPWLEIVHLSPSILPRLRPYLLPLP